MEQIHMKKNHMEQTHMNRNKFMNLTNLIGHHLIMT